MGSGRRDWGIEPMTQHASLRTGSIAEMDIYYMY
jgi:hypothetical protein